MLTRCTVRRSRLDGRHGVPRWLGVPCGPVNTVPEAFAQAHVAHRRMRVEREGYRGIGLPTQLSRTPGCPGRSPPRHGQHTDELLREAGFSEARIATLRERGVLPQRA